MADQSAVEAAERATHLVVEHWDAMVEQLSAPPLTASFGFVNPNAVIAMLESIRRHASDALDIMRKTKWPDAASRDAIRPRAG